MEQTQTLYISVYAMTLTLILKQGSETITLHLPMHDFFYQISDQGFRGYGMEWS